MLDLGCGFGVGVLTAAAASRRDGDGTAFVGCDLSPLGVAVVCEGHHMCMMMRGVEKQNSITTTSAMLGEFSTNPNSRDEFLRLINTSYTSRG